MSHGDERAPRPPEKPSDEADARQLALARREGEAYGEALEYMVSEVADTGGEQRGGDYVIAFAQERAEGMYRPGANDELAWEEPAAGENCHLEIAVRDAGDGRFVPYLTVRVMLTPAEGGQRVGPVVLPFLWHPGLYHYGANLAVAGDGEYSLHVRVEPPSFPRHDRTNGRRYAECVEVEFPRVRITTGRG